MLSPIVDDIVRAPHLKEYQGPLAGWAGTLHRTFLKCLQCHIFRKSTPRSTELLKTPFFANWRHVIRTFSRARESSGTIARTRHAKDALIEEYEHSAALVSTSCCLLPGLHSDRLRDHFRTGSFCPRSSKSSLHDEGEVCLHSQSGSQPFRLLS